MRVFVDTSVWIDFFRGKAKRGAQCLDRLLTEDQVALSIVVRVELLTGFKEKNRRAMTTLLAAIPTYSPSDTTWKQIEQWATEGATHGESFGVGDLIIAACAAEQRAPVWSFDSDFKRMNEMQFIETFSADRLV